MLIPRFRTEQVAGVSPYAGELADDVGQRPVDRLLLRLHQLVPVLLIPLGKVASDVDRQYLAEVKRHLDLLYDSRMTSFGSKLFLVALCFGRAHIKFPLITRGKRVCVCACSSKCYVILIAKQIFELTRSMKYHNW